MDLDLGHEIWGFATVLENQRSGATMLSVLIATHNGTDTLERTLSRLTEIDRPLGGWKLVVIDNASTDHTKAVIDRFEGKLPLEYVFEPRLGRPRALNTGLTRVQGDLVVITDDDVLPERDWLLQWRAAVDRNPGYSLFGGVIEPLFEREPPEWLLKTAWCKMLFAEVDSRSPEGRMDPRHIFGPNMGFRTSILDEDIRFDETRLVGLSGLLGDETDFFSRLSNRGHKACFVPRAKLFHIVQKEQLTWRWMLKRFYRHGRTMYVDHVAEYGRNLPEIMRIPRYLVRRILERMLTLPLTIVRFDKLALITHLRLIAYDVGSARQALNLYAPESKHAKKR